MASVDEQIAVLTAKGENDIYRRRIKAHEANIESEQYRIRNLESLIAANDKIIQAGASDHPHTPTATLTEEVA